jgi:ABC-type glutathione transport system ATPase component
VQLVLTVAGLAWIDPLSAPPAALAAAFALCVPFLTQRMLAERELRKRTHAAATSRFYLDGLLGLVTARTHGAERSLRRGHEARVVEWAPAGLHLGDLLDRMPGGLFQLVGETGWQLSHGERSRLFMARALLQGADLVVLDEKLGRARPREPSSLPH